MITEKVTKLDVARRQLDEAIRMFFERRDTVSTHTVVSAAAQVLADLGKNRGFQGWTRNKAIIQAHRWQEWRRTVTRFEAFFKHADSDSEATCDFHPEMTPLFIIESVELLRMFTGRLTWPGLIFSIWFMLANPELVTDGELKRFVTERASLVKCDTNDFAMMAELLNMRDTVPEASVANYLM